jgi:hypothetical protein
MVGAQAEKMRRALGAGGLPVRMAIVVMMRMMMMVINTPLSSRWTSKDREELWMTPMRG